MNLLIDSLTATPTKLSFEGSSAWWIEQIGARPAAGPKLLKSAQFEGVAYLLGENILIEGEVTGEVEIECGRCLKRYGHALRDAYRLVLEPAGDRVPSDPEGISALKRDGLCLGEELESGWYSCQELQLDSFFAELVSLGLPVQPLCREDCAGLCSHCGVDLSQSRCNCEDETLESPFAALAVLRRDDAEEGEI